MAASSTEQIHHELRYTVKGSKATGVGKARDDNQGTDQLGFPGLSRDFTESNTDTTTLCNTHAGGDFTIGAGATITLCDFATDKDWDGVALTGAICRTALLTIVDPDGAKNLNVGQYADAAALDFGQGSTPFNFNHHFDPLKWKGNFSGTKLKVNNPTGGTISGTWLLGLKK